MNPITNITGTAVPIIGDDIDTDRIVPARFLKEITFENMGHYLFIDARQDDNGKANNHPLNNDVYKNASIMIVGRNFGCGSSREHAPQAIKRAGFNAIIGESFSEIFSGNCLSLGIPTVLMNRHDIETLQALITAEPNTTFTLDIEQKKLFVNNDSMPVMIKAESRNALLSGNWNAKAVLIANMSKIKETAKSLPYISGY